MIGMMQMMHMIKVHDQVQMIWMVQIFSFSSNMFVRQNR